MVPWNSARTKVQIKLSIQRTRSLQEKKLALAKKSRREIADLLLKGRVETARLRVEGLIQDDIYVELLELLELYLETLQARFNLLDASNGTEPEPSISDAVCSIVYAAPRTELKELHTLREMLMHKYGRAFALTLLPDQSAPPSVPTRISSKLSLFVPGKELVDAYLGEIARGYGVDWVPAPEFSKDADGDDSLMDKKGEENGDNEEGETTKENNGNKKDDKDDEDRGSGPKEAPLTVPPQKKDPVDKSESGVTPNMPAPPAGPEKDAWAGTNTPLSGGKGTEDEELAKRFERLKNLR